MRKNVYKIVVSCDLSFDIFVSTPFIFMLRPQSGVHQWVCWDRYELDPVVDMVEFTDDYGNLCQRLLAPEGKFSLSVGAELIVPGSVDREPGAPFVEIQNLPNEVLKYLLPSRYCDSEYFTHMAGEITGGQSLGYEQAAAIESWIRDSVRYEFCGNDDPVSASEVNTRKSGVCRDLAHLGIALCRALCIPARMVVGYLHGLVPMDLHAWYEVYVGDRWYTFDPSQKKPSGGYVVLGYGRDAADVAVYNQFGPAVYPIEKRVSVTAKSETEPYERM